jgi:hypothetical protein
MWILQNTLSIEKYGCEDKTRFNILFCELDDSDVEIFDFTGAKKYRYLIKQSVMERR